MRVDLELTYLQIKAMTMEIIVKIGMIMNLWEFEKRQLLQVKELEK